MVILFLAAFFLEEGQFLQHLFGGQSDRLGASPEVIEAA
jgi:hypothetical protein